MTIIRSTITGVLDDEGYLCTPTAAGGPAYRGVELIANDDADLNPQNATYIVTYNLRAPNGDRLDYPRSHQITVLSGATIDLTTVIPADGAQEIGIPQAEALAAAAAESAAAAQAAAELAVLATSPEGLADQADDPESPLGTSIQGAALVAALIYGGN